MVTNGTRNIVHETAVQLEECRERCRYRKLAHEAWTLERKAYSGPCVHDYGKGFRDGFVDFLMEGGPGEPPPVPPQHYWHNRFQNEQGYDAMKAWFAGFRQGAAAAKASGYRQWVTLPVSVAIPEGLPVEEHLPHAVPSTAVAPRENRPRLTVTDEPPAPERASPLSH